MGIIGIIYLIVTAIMVNISGRDNLPVFRWWTWVCVLVSFAFFLIGGIYCINTGAPEPEFSRVQETLYRRIK